MDSKGHTTSNFGEDSGIPWDTSVFFPMNQSFIKNSTSNVSPFPLASSLKFSKMYPAWLESINFNAAAETSYSLAGAFREVVSLRCKYGETLGLDTQLGDHDEITLGAR
jgi:hypothetical protein